ncbi:MAG: hypothetical protein ACLFT0_12570 [Spirulinaceae cyanobacterium]
MTDLKELGIRPADPLPECKNYNGWIARARFRMTDQEIMVLDNHYFYESIGTELEGKEIYTYINSETKIKTIPTEEDRLASFRWEREERGIRKKESSETDEYNEDDKSFTGHLTFTLNKERGNDGLFLGTGLKFSAVVRIISVASTEVENTNPRHHWWIFQGEPEDLDKLYEWLKKNYEYSQETIQNNDYSAYAIDVNEDYDGTYCSRGTLDGWGFYGAICRFYNTITVRTFNKIVSVQQNGSDVRARVRDMQLGRKNPWIPFEPRYQDHVYWIDFPKDPNLRPLHKKGELGLKGKLRKTTDNLIGLPGTDAYDVELYLPKKEIVGGEEVEVPDQSISARLDSVEFYYCGCVDGEIECEDKDGNVCCVDCCKIGETVLAAYSSQK